MLERVLRGSGKHRGGGDGPKYRGPNTSPKSKSKPGIISRLSKFSSVLKKSPKTVGELVNKYMTHENEGIHNKIPTANMAKILKRAKPNELERVLGIGYHKILNDYEKYVDVGLKTTLEGQKNFANMLTAHQKTEQNNSSQPVSNFTKMIQSKAHT